jgi:tetratricopeptide (TPR) repeat protein
MKNQGIDGQVELGSSFLTQGRAAEATDLLRKALAAQRDLPVAEAAATGDREVMILLLVGDAEFLLERFDTALASFEEALGLCAGLDDKRPEALALSGCGECHLARGELIEARDRYQCSLDLFAAYGETEAEMWVAIDLGLTGCGLGESSAQKTFDRALELATELESCDGEVAALCGLSLYRLRAGDYRGALSELERARAVIREHERAGLEPMVLVGFANLRYAQGRPKMAMVFLNRVERTIDPTGKGGDAIGMVKRVIAVAKRKVFEPTGGPTSEARAEDH